MVLLIESVGRNYVVWFQVFQVQPNSVLKKASQSTKIARANFPNKNILTKVNWLSHLTFYAFYEKVFSGIETNNKFRIKNSAGQQLYFAGEETDYCTRRLCGSRRRFEMHIADTTGKVST